jgi:rubredoxin
MNCPKCGSSELYRKHPHSLNLQCDRCGYCFTDSQPQQPILSAQAYRKSQPRGTHTVRVWYCPSDSSKYSFSVTYGGGIAHFGEFPDDPFLKGCYVSPQEALEAGVKWVKGEQP